MIRKVQIAWAVWFPAGWSELVHAWAYDDSHRQEIDEEIRQNEAA